MLSKNEQNFKIFVHGTSNPAKTVVALNANLFFKEPHQLTK